MPAGVQRLYVPVLPWTIARGITGGPAAERETVRSVPMAKVRRLAEMTGPATVNGDG